MIDEKPGTISKAPCEAMAHRPSVTDLLRSLTAMDDVLDRVAELSNDESVGMGTAASLAEAALSITPSTRPNEIAAKVGYVMSEAKSHDLATSTRLTAILESALRDLDRLDRTTPPEPQPDQAASAWFDVLPLPPATTLSEIEKLWALRSEIQAKRRHNFEVMESSGLNRSRSEKTEAEETKLVKQLWDFDDSLIETPISSLRDLELKTRVTQLRGPSHGEDGKEFDPDYVARVLNDLLAFLAPN